MQKKLVDFYRKRSFRTPFSWLDQRLLRENHLRLCDSQSLGVYLFLVLASDQDGLSYYSDDSICQWLSMKMNELFESRLKLIQADLIAYRKPIYQVLSLPSMEDLLSSERRKSHAGMVSVKDILKQIRAGL